MKNRKAGDFLIGKIVFVVFFSPFCFINDIALDHGIVTEVQGIRAKNKNLVIDISDVIKKYISVGDQKTDVLYLLKAQKFLIYPQQKYPNLTIAIYAGDELSGFLFNDEIQIVIIFNGNTVERINGKLIYRSL